jgi:hypothetical protein
MGHLINPVAIRLGWFSNWCDSWFSDFSFYPEMLHHVFRIRIFLNYFFFQEIFISWGILFSHFVVHYKSGFLFVNIFVYDSSFINDFYVFYDDYLRLVYPNYKDFDNVEDVNNVDMKALKMKANDNNFISENNVVNESISEKNVFSNLFKMSYRERKLISNRAEFGLGFFYNDKSDRKVGTSLRNRRVGFVLFLLLFLFSKTFPFEYSNKFCFLPFFSNSFFSADVVFGHSFFNFSRFWSFNFDFKFFFSLYYFSYKYFFFVDEVSAFFKSKRYFAFEERLIKLFLKFFVEFLNSPYAFYVFWWKFFKQNINVLDPFFLFKKFLPDKFYSKLARSFVKFDFRYLSFSGITFCKRFNLKLSLNVYGSSKFFF